MALSGERIIIGARLTVSKGKSQCFILTTTKYTATSINPAKNIPAGIDRSTIRRNLRTTMRTPRLLRRESTFKLRFSHPQERRDTEHQQQPCRVSNKKKIPPP
jgi:hypothetical protein